MERHKVPVHLETPDILFLGLTARQTLILASGGTLAYMTVADAGADPVLWGFALVLAVVVVLATLLVAFVRPKKRGLEVWAMVVLSYLMLPKCYVWRPLPPEREASHRVHRRAKAREEDEGE
jgi:hypothetical protein